MNCNICGLFTLTASDIGSDDDTEFRKYMCFKPILPNVVLCLNPSLVDRVLGRATSYSYLVESKKISLSRFLSLSSYLAIANRE